MFTQNFRSPETVFFSFFLIVVTPEVIVPNSEMRSPVQQVADNDNDEYVFFINNREKNGKMYENWCYEI